MEEGEGTPPTGLFFLAAPPTTALTPTLILPLIPQSINLIISIHGFSGQARRSQGSFHLSLSLEHSGLVCVSSHIPYPRRRPLGHALTRLLCLTGAATTGG